MATGGRAGPAASNAKAESIFAAKDARRYQDAYQMLAPTFEAMTPYEAHLEEGVD